MILRRFPGISMEAASGVAQAVRSRLLSHGDCVAHRKASKCNQQQEFVGWFHSLPQREQEALVELSRVTVKEMRDVDRFDHEALNEYTKVCVLMRSRMLYELGTKATQCLHLHADATQSEREG